MDQNYPGVRERGGRYRVRVRPYPETYRDTYDEAVALAIEYRKLRGSGIRQAPRKPTATTLAAACETFLKRKRTAGGKYGKISPNGLTDWTAKVGPWIADVTDSRGIAVGAHPVASLPRQDVHDYLMTRAATRPTAARNELQGLKAVLRSAAAAGHPVDQAILHMEPIRVTTREGRALTPYELDYLAGFAPDYIERLIRLGGSTGMRIGELFALDDVHLDLGRRDPVTGEAAPAIDLPPELVKERRRKVIDLFPSEVTLLREQRLARAPGSTLLFPKKLGSAWRYTHFHDKVWRPTIKRAAAAWAVEHPDTPCPFTRPDELELHDLRRTSATLMRDARMEPEEAAARFGHKDAGYLLMTTYRKDRGGAVRRRIAELGPSLMDAAVPAPPAAFAAAAGTTRATEGDE